MPDVPWISFLSTVHRWLLFHDSLVKIRKSRYFIIFYGTTDANFVIMAKKKFGKIRNRAELRSVRHSSRRKQTATVEEKLNIAQEIIKIYSRKIKCLSCLSRILINRMNSKSSLIANNLIIIVMIRNILYRLK